jgi:hypothetical protein
MHLDKTMHDILNFNPIVKLNLVELELNFGILIHSI